MRNKIIFNFSGHATAKKFVERVRALPYVTYATDYSRGPGTSSVMVCGEFTEEQEQELNSLKSRRHANKR